MIEIAWDRLLNSNLPAKYSITGVLKFDNLLDGILFYDAGKVCVFLVTQLAKLQKKQCGGVHFGLYGIAY